MNTKNAEAYSIYFYGSGGVGSSENRVQQVNISGTHWNTSGVFPHAGVSKIWYEPTRTVISDPYVRNMGWDGGVATTIAGRMVGCHDRARGSYRQNSGPFYVDQMTGGITFEYGFISFSPRVVNKVGSSQASPFVVQVKDWGSSGPGTGYPAGVMVKQMVQPVFFKGDPHFEYGNTAPFRFIQFVSLPPNYGNGFYEGELTSCAAGNATNNNWPDARENIIRVEANDNVGVNFGWDVAFSGDWKNNWRRGQLIHLAYEPWSTSDRSFGHVVRLTSGTAIPDTVYLHDTNTATGPGVFADVSVRPVQIYQSSSYIQPKNNKILDTNVSGKVAISPNSGSTTISNVSFTGSSRVVVDVGAGSVVNMSAICVPSGSQVTGAGTAYMNGQMLTLPFIFSALNDCAVGESDVPLPPQDIVVQ
jgi:hypothetical protein